MKVLITGGAGFLGRRLAAKLLQRGRLKGADGGDHRIDQIVLVDVVEGVPFADARIRYVVGDISNPDFLALLFEDAPASIFHLAAIVSGQAEADFELGMRINLDASVQLLELCRQTGHRPKLTFASSVAVYGGDLPAVVLESTALTPLSSYGTQKAVIELFINDYTRKGFIDGRVLRLPTICVRPGKPNAAASSFASGIIREPLNGEAAVCPVSAQTRLWLLSPQTAIDAILFGHEIPSDALGANRNINLPGLTITVAQMVAALERVAGAQVAQRIRWELDPRIERLVSTWPGELEAKRARSLGFPGDTDFDAVIRQHLEDQRGVPT